ncbi:MAG: MotE family protein [Caulobacterales bacterium]
MKPNQRITRFLMSGGSVRLMPTLMITMAALLSLKAVALAETAAEGVAAAAEGLDLGATTQATAPDAPAAAADAAGQCELPSFAEQAGLSQSEVQVLQALGARREALDARASEMDTQTQLLTAAEQRLTERLTELRALEAEVSGLLGQLDAQEQQRLAGLVDVYQRMRAKDAAEVFDALDMDVLIRVASRMRQQNLAEIMGRMDVTRARELTTRLAEQNRLANDPQGLLDQARANQ